MTRHFTASGLILRDGHVLLVRHLKSGLWLYPGGHLNDNEDPAQAALREISEEVALRVEIVSEQRFSHPAVSIVPVPFTTWSTSVGRCRDRSPSSPVRSAATGGSPSRKWPGSRLLRSSQSCAPPPQPTSAGSNPRSTAELKLRRAEDELPVAAPRRRLPTRPRTAVFWMLPTPCRRVLPRWRAAGLYDP